MYSDNPTPFVAIFARITTLAWSPDGRLLSAGSPDFSGLVLFDVAQGTSLRVGAGFSTLRLLRWSPDGAYLLAGETVTDVQQPHSRLGQNSLVFYAGLSRFRISGI